MISGKEAFLRGRCKRDFISSFLKTSGGDVEEVESRRLSERISSRAFLNEKCLLILNEVDESCYELLLRHEKKPFPGIVFLIVSEEAIRKNSVLGKLSSKIGDKKHKKFELVASYREFETACDFLVKEIRGAGLSIPATLARKVVSEVGNDLGFLSFQAWKMANLAMSLGVSEIDEEFCKRTTLQVLEFSLFPLIEAIGMQKPITATKQLLVIEKTHTTPTMKVCRFVGTFAVKWASTRNLLDREVPEKEALEILSASPWYYRNKLVNIVSRWTVKDLARLLLVCSKTEQAVFEGAINPWIYFCSKTYNLLSSLRKPL